MVWGNLLFIFRYYYVIGSSLANRIGFKVRKGADCQSSALRLHSLKPAAEFFPLTLGYWKAEKILAAQQLEDGKHIFWLIKSKLLELLTFPFFN